MKNINTFILEKLKVNSKTDIQSPVIEKIIEAWGLIDDSDEMIEVIKQWIKDNKINNVQPVADKETLRDASEFLSDETLESYICSPKEVEECEDRLSKAIDLYTYNQNGENLYIMATEDMICIIGWYGTLYCLKK